MRFLILNADYPEFLWQMYDADPRLSNAAFEVQLEARASSLFGVADFYARNLRALGCEAHDVHVNNEPMQRAWARENGVTWRSQSPALASVDGVFLASRPPRDRVGRYVRRFTDFVHGRIGRDPWPSRILLAQIEHLKPDVVINQAMETVRSDFWSHLVSPTFKLVGQIASPLPENEDFGCYDLVLSSLPNYVDFFRRQGVRSRLHRLGFESRIVEQVVPQERTIDFSFVGSLSQAHSERVRLLERLCREVNLQVWGTGVESLPPESPIRRNHHGAAWGRQMYEILARSRMTLNKHIEIAGDFANNSRLYEATGMRSALITDMKSNLSQMFEPDVEVIAYESADEAVELAMGLLDDTRRLAGMAKAGQARTLSEHTYAVRMKELLKIIELEG